VRNFLFGYACVLLALFGWNLYLMIDEPFYQGRDYTLLMFRLICAPLFGTAGVVVLLQQFRPRKVLDRSRQGTFMPFAYGAVAAMLAVGVASVPIAYSNGSFFDAISLGVCSAMATAVILLVGSRRRRPGCCLGCGFDIRASIDFGRCPECGLPC